MGDLSVHCRLSCSHKNILISLLTTITNQFNSNQYTCQTKNLNIFLAVCFQKNPTMIYWLIMDGRIFVGQNAPGIWLGGEPWNRKENFLLSVLEHQSFHTKCRKMCLGFKRNPKNVPFVYLAHVLTPGCSRDADATIICVQVARATCATNGDKLFISFGVSASP